MNELTPEQQAEIDALKALPDDQIGTSDALDLIESSQQVRKDRRKGQLIPGGFDGIGEPIEELKLVLETVNKVIALGVTEKWQHFLTSRIYEALGYVSRWYDDEQENDW